MKRLLIAVGTALAAAVIVPPATFAGQSMDNIAPGLVVREKGAISYVSGGIGDEQQNALAGMSGRFNLKLTLATKDGKYIGRGDIKIEDQNGMTVLETRTDGPLFYAKMPPGTYKIHVSANGKSFTRDIMVPGKGQEQLVLTWPAAPEEPVRAGDAPE